MPEYAFIEENPPECLSGDIMLYLPDGGGFSFRCECRCNVFKQRTDRLPQLIYRCNGCGNLWEGIRDDSQR